MEEPLRIVVMGVSGSGKTTVAEGLAKALACRFVDADALHPAANVAKMQSGVPLTDEDRWPWLDAVAEVLAEPPVVAACSALRRTYRDRLRRVGEVWCVELDVTEDVLRARLEQRQGHFMPPALLASQLATLEPLADDEDGIVMPALGTVDETVAAVIAALART